MAYRPSSIEALQPALELVDPEPIAARHAVRSLVDGSGISDDDIAGLVGALSEVVTNAQVYGRPPVQVRAWVQGPHAVVTVTDRGTGPDDPDTGIEPIPRPAGNGGLGLWLARQMCRSFVMGRHDDGFRVRMEAGAP